MEQGHAPRETTADRLYREMMGEDVYRRQVQARVAETSCTCGLDKAMPAHLHAPGCGKIPEPGLKRRVGKEGAKRK